MILGKTRDEAVLAKQAETKKKILGIKKFAWFPEKLGNGQYVWLQMYWRHYRFSFFNNQLMIDTIGDGAEYYNAYLTQQKIDLSNYDVL